MKNKILLIAHREFFAKIASKGFVWSTLLGPVLMASTLIVPTWISSDTTATKKILILDESHILTAQAFRHTSPHYDVVFANLPLSEGKKMFLSSDYDALLHLPHESMLAVDGLTLYTKTGFSTESKLLLESICNKWIERWRLKLANIDTALIENIKSNLRIQAIQLNKQGENEQHLAYSTFMGLFMSILIYVFILIYSAQVLRGVLEEKSSRVVELLVTSVKPFQLMMGKILGIALAALLQFALWIAVVTSISAFLSNHYKLERFAPEHIAYTLSHTSDMTNAVQIYEMMSAIHSFNFIALSWVFVYYFIFGYLLYGAIFAAIGAMSDADTDTQQFVLPVTMPLIGTFVFVPSIIQNPDSYTAILLSMLPLTAPVAMMVRYPFGIPDAQLALSMGLLALAFVLITAIAAKIYHITILMYGNKPTYRQAWKWLWQKG